MTLLPGHRAVLPDGFTAAEITTGPVRWQDGQETAADAVVWAIGRVRPNTDWMPPALLDDQGFVTVGPTLQAPGHPAVFAIGDVAATDPLRSSARSRADKLLARNVRAHLSGRALRSFTPPRYRWGSVLGRRAGRAPRLRPRRPAVPVPGLVGAQRPAAMDRAAGHLPRHPGRVTLPP